MFRSGVVASCAALILSASALAYDPAPADATPSSRITFAWPLGDGAPKPRGASTRGAPVTLDTAPSPAWTRLQDPALSWFERDREAILGMAGEYRVSFDFLEIARFDPSLKPDVPYQSWGTEIVLVGRNERDVIELQHILVMRMLDEDGKPGEPMVMRHWRQEWRFEPKTMLVYRGNETWERVELTPEQRERAWVQRMYQVDDSPRYSSVGRWEHTGSYSTWIGSETLRPLPRREFSVRKDYQTLLGTNRHTITPTGWIQEENNLKQVLDAKGQPHATRPFLAREYGVARYERIKDFDFSAGRTYFERTEPFWAQVRLGWDRFVDRRRGSVKVKAPVDQAGLYKTFFEHAQRIADGEIKANPLVDQMLVSSTLRDRYLTR